jgi:adenylate cyclase class 1
LESLVETPGSPHRRKEFEALVQGFAEQVQAAGLNARDAAMADSALAFLSYKGASDADTSEGLLSFSKGLSCAGSASLRYFLRLMIECEENEERMKRTYEAVPESLRPAVVNVVFHAAAKLPQAVVAFCVQTLPKLKKMDAAHAEAFIERLEALSETPAFALVEALRLKLSPLTIARLDACTEENEIERAVKAFAELLEETPPEGLPRLIEMFRTTSKRVRRKNTKLIVSLLKNEAEEVRRRALVTLFMDAPKNSGKAAAHLFSAGDDFSRAVPVFSSALSRREYHDFLSHLQGKEKQRAVMRAFCGLCAFDPVFVSRALEARPGDVAEEMKKLLGARDKDALLAWATKDMAEKDMPQPVGAENISSEDPFLAMEIGNIDGKQMQVERRLLEDKHFLEGTLRSACFHDVVFKNCRFVGVDFRRASFSNCRFEGCSFRDCEMRAASFFDSTLQDVVFKRCDISESGFHRVRAVMLEMTACLCHEITVRRSSFMGFTASFTDFSHSKWHACHLGGSGMLCSPFQHSLFSSCTFQASDFCDAVMTEAAFPDCSLDAAELLHREEERLLASLDALDPSACDLLCTAADAEALDSAKCMVASAVLDDWFILRSVKKKSAVFLSENKRRHDRLLKALSPEAAAFFHLAPLLLCSEAFELDTVLPLPPGPLSIAGYAPGLEALQSFRKSFPKHDLPDLQETPVALEGLFTIGSCGSVAQTSSSDIDYWCIYNSKRMPKPYVDALDLKLKALSTWAMEVFDLEVHFFLMDTEEVKSNNFGFSDEESSGSAQALLLKEEFYRTAVRVAGKMPVWWLTGVDEDNTKHEDTMNELLAVGLSEHFVDLGGVRHIPPEEFFGASLWQIVKALKSPFKSILKFGLLEKYISEAGGSGMLLCNSLKHNLLSGHLRLMETDPYMLLYREVLDHYIRVGDKSAAELVRMAFAFKTHLQDKLCKADHIVNADQLELALFTRLHMPGEHIAGPSCGIEDWEFQKLKELDASIRNFIIETYKRVREQTADSKTSITPQDLTTLGRKIFAVYAKKENKIERLPFVSQQRKLFDKLVISAQKGGLGAAGLWCFSGVRFASSGERQALSEVVRAGDPVGSAAYMTINGLYKKGLSVDADHTAFPLSAKDTRDMLDVLVEVFPPDETLNVDMKDIFRAEEIVKTLFVINAVAPREEERVIEASVLYASNWGELFCKHIRGVNINDIENIHDLVHEITGKDIAVDMETEYWTPERSRCVLHPDKYPLRKPIR